MKLNVEVPVDLEAKKAAVADPPPQEVVTQAVHKPEVKAAVLTDAPATGSALQQAAAPPGFYSGSMLLLGAGAGALLVIVGAVFALYGSDTLRRFQSERQGKTQDELRAAGKA